MRCRGLSGVPSTVSWSQRASPANSSSGKGVSAALTMANVQATLKARLPLMADLSQLVDSIDHDFDKSSPRGVYATLFAAVLDSHTRILRYVNAGHNPGYLISNGRIEMMKANALPIGILPQTRYATQVGPFPAGACAVLYSDGITEAENIGGEVRSEERRVGKECSIGWRSRWSRGQ